MNYGKFGGQYVPQELKNELNYIEKEFIKATEDEEFKKLYGTDLKAKNLIQVVDSEKRQIEP